MGKIRKAIEKLVPGRTTVYTRAEKAFKPIPKVQFTEKKVKKAPEFFDTSPELSGYRDAMRKNKLGGKGWGH